MKLFVTVVILISAVLALEVQKCKLTQNILRLIYNFILYRYKGGSSA
jgi:hypothetical protein